MATRTVITRSHVYLTVRHVGFGNDRSGVRVRRSPVVTGCTVSDNSNMVHRGAGKIAAIGTRRQMARLARTAGTHGNRIVR